MDTHSDVQKPQEAKTDTARHGFWGGVEDFLQSTVYSAIQKPIDGIEQLADHVTGAHLPEIHLIDAPKDHNWETSLGNIAGTAIDVLAVGCGVGAAFEAAGLAGEAATLPVIAQGAIKGAAIGGIVGAVQPIDSSKNYWATKAKETAIGAVGLGAAGAAVGPLTEYMGTSILGQLGTRGSSSVIGNLAHGMANDLINLQQPSLYRLLG